MVHTYHRSGKISRKCNELIFYSVSRQHKETKAQWNIRNEKKQKTQQQAGGSTTDDSTKSKLKTELKYKLK